LRNSDNLKPHVESRADGIYWVEPKSDKDTGEIITRESWLCSALEVIGTGIDDSKTRYLILRWRHSVRRGIPSRQYHLLILVNAKAGERSRLVGERHNQKWFTCNAGRLAAELCQW
jgi:hypothetical protein